MFKNEKQYPTFTPPISPTRNDSLSRYFSRGPFNKFPSLYIAHQLQFLGRLYVLFAYKCKSCVICIVAANLSALLKRTSDTIFENSQ